MNHTDTASTTELKRSLQRLAGQPTQLSEREIQQAAVRHLNTQRRWRRAAGVAVVVAMFFGGNVVLDARQTTQRVDVQSNQSESALPTESLQIPQARELLDAVRDDDAVRVLALLEAGADPNSAERLNMSPLMVAAIRNNTEIAALLLDVGAKVDGVSDPGYRVIHIAAQYGDREMIELLAVHGVDLDATSDQIAKMTPLMLATRVGNTAAIDALLSNGADPMSTDAYGRSAMAYAFAAPDTRLIVDQLIAGGVAPGECPHLNVASDEARVMPPGC